jgi:sulfur relay (sulfurtransferase) complex TusBCD TusD component (DsrE family)
MRYLLVETRTAWEDPAVEDFLALADGLAGTGGTVDLFLVQNAVLMARRGAAAGLDRLLEGPGKTVWVDDFAMAARGLSREALADGTRPADIGMLVQLLASPGCKAIWH